VTGKNKPIQKAGNFTGGQRCAVCGGPIVDGTPVLIFDNGLIHREKKTCEDFKLGKKDPLGTGAKRDPKDRPPRNRRLKVRTAGSEHS
jgi:hypothetical protein